MLSLPTKQKQKMLTFGSEQEEQQMCDVVRIMINIDGNMSNCLSSLYPLFASQLCNQPIAFCMAHLAPLERSDFHNGKTELDIDILIGSDHYWKIVMGDEETLVQLLFAPTSDGYCLDPPTSLTLL